MAVIVTDIGTSKFLIPDTNELEVVTPPPTGITHRMITRLRFHNFDSISHTPTISIRQSDLSLLNAGVPELWRLYIPRAIEASGEQDDCGVIHILSPTESLVVELVVDPSDTSDNQTWPSITAHWIDQFILAATPAIETVPTLEAIEDGLSQLVEVVA